MTPRARARAGDDSEAAGPDIQGTVDRAFGEENRGRLLDRYFSSVGPIDACNAWEHVYRLLLWIDPTIGLAHCYESDKCQPGRPWYDRSRKFHAWVAGKLGVQPSDLVQAIDWLFRHAAEDLAAKVAEQRNSDARSEDVAATAALGLPIPGTDPELARIICEELGSWLRESPPNDVLARLAERLHAHTRLENKRKNLVGEGFEDVLAAVIKKSLKDRAVRVLTRKLLEEVPGFHESSRGEKLKKVDLVLLVGAGERRILISAKWSIRADREEQFASDFDAYCRREKASQTFEHVLITNEFDPARLLRACDRQVSARPLFSEVVHVNPVGLLAAYGSPLQDSRADAAERIKAGRLRGLADWLVDLGGRC